MKKIIVTTLFSIVLFACGNKENNQSIENLIATKNVKALNEKKTALQAEISKIDAALATLDTKKETEALVSTQVIKDTLFNHYLEIQGNVDTKENILVQPEMSGTLVTLNVKAGQQVAQGQILGSVDDSGTSNQVASLETQYQLAKTTFERQKNLWNQKIGSEIQYLQANGKFTKIGCSSKSNVVKNVNSRSVFWNN
jgi:membrane fusion protein, multidrug efflux system